MKKLSIGVLALLVGSSAFAAAPTSSTIVLKGGGDVAPAATVSISLASLLKDVHYDVSCQVVNPNSDDVDMRFQPSGSHVNLMFGQAYLNETAMNNLQGSLKAGENTMTVNEMTVPSAGDASQVALQFKNLDFKNTVQVGQCVAKPSIQKQAMPKSGYFIAYNNTGAFVDISIGNFFPTPYTIFPWSSRWINVSTDNQNIYINGIY